MSIITQHAPETMTSAVGAAHQRVKVDPFHINTTHEKTNHFSWRGRRDGRRHTENALSFARRDFTADLNKLLF